MTQPNPPAPPTQHRNTHAVPTRFIAPDVARGLMLLFIALANVVTAWAPAQEGMMAQSIGGVREDSLLDKIVVVFGAMFVHVRGLPMFATLLGFGVGMISLSLLRRGYPRPKAQAVLLRRYGWLMFFGAIHMVFLFFGDIMFTYGLCGLVLAGLIAVGNKHLKWIAGGLWIVGAIVTFLLNMAGTPLMEAASTYLGYLGYGAAMLLGMLFASPLLLISLLPPMIVGLLMARMLMLHDVPAHRRGLTIWAGIAVAFILLVGLPWGLAEIGVLPASWAPLLYALNQAAGYLTGPGLVAAIALLVQPAQRRMNQDGTMNPMMYALVALGKRSMSGYVAQSVLFFPLVLPFTLHLAEGMGAAGKSLIAVGVWLLTLLAAVALERAGKPGPLESLHRRLSYGKEGLQKQWQPEPGRGE
ncbi:MULTISPECIES: DUF418 domain-containing protein [unclassified Corynebacterium]|uniref:DUF418 domain-containing protein n=1 Tax=unclassified Corynebacterium TaxID=2624378 RepID=UPI0029C9DFB6|nr:MULTISPECIES: DUF418 domain-containing protein [unclassified Corynebacterium]WPF65234.1 DUF418 domain-containing protein [Corynebacterium sp. 22KM0430]WPF67729.1 DUF418 domain-containing protein [Corynebacterium sp. 21KM1197]